MFRPLNVHLQVFVRYTCSVDFKLINKNIPAYFLTVTRHTLRTIQIIIFEISRHIWMTSGPHPTVPVLMSAAGVAAM
jgi:hypothetical protein